TGCLTKIIMNQFGPLPARVLFVCLGNICRSPLAEGIFRKKISARNLGHRFTADSCGTGNYHIGQQPDPRTIRNAGRNGVTLDHRCRQLKEQDLEVFDHIIAMDKSNFRNIMVMETAGVHKEKIRLMRDWDPKPTSAEVPDPYHGDDRDFQEVFEILDRCMDAFIDHLEISGSTDRKSAD
ncbi:MAG: low molecular weight protein-tyrosine-phosphatase, partial [Bacteroidota bacterium]